MNINEAQDILDDTGEVSVDLFQYLQELNRRFHRFDQSEVVEHAQDILDLGWYEAMEPKIG